MRKELVRPGTETQEQRAALQEMLKRFDMPTGRSFPSIKCSRPRAKLLHPVMSPDEVAVEFFSREAAMASETVADIIAELRGYTHGFSDYMRLPMTYGTFRRYLARLEKAAKKAM